MSDIHVPGREDVATAAAVSPASRPALWHNLAAAAASGWDFSSRWLEDGRNLSTCRASMHVPADLNAFLFQAQILPHPRAFGVDVTCPCCGLHCLEAWAASSRDGNKVLRRLLMTSRQLFCADGDESCRVCGQAWRAQCLHVPAGCCGQEDSHQHPALERDSR